MSCLYHFQNLPTGIAQIPPLAPLPLMINHKPALAQAKEFFKKYLTDSHFTFISAERTLAIFYQIMQREGGERALLLLAQNLPGDAHYEKFVGACSDLLALTGDKIVTLLQKKLQNSQSNPNLRILALLTLSKIMLPEQFLVFLQTRPLTDKLPTRFLPYWVEVAAAACQTQPAIAEIADLINNSTLPNKNYFLLMFFNKLLKKQPTIDFDLFNQYQTHLDQNCRSTFYLQTEDPRGKSLFLQDVNAQNFAQKLPDVLARGWLTDFLAAAPELFTAKNLLAYFQANTGSKPEDAVHSQTLLAYLSQPEQTALRQELEKLLLLTPQCPDKSLFVLFSRGGFDFLKSSPHPQETLIKIEKFLNRPDPKKRVTWLMAAHLLAVKAHLARQLGQEAEAKLISEFLFSNTSLCSEQTKKTLGCRSSFREEATNPYALRYKLPQDIDDKNSRIGYLFKEDPVFFNLWQQGFEQRTLPDAAAKNQRHFGHNLIIEKGDPELFQKFCLNQKDNYLLNPNRQKRIARQSVLWNLLTAQVQKDWQAACQTQTTLAHQTLGGQFLKNIARTIENEEPVSDSCPPSFFSTVLTTIPQMGRLTPTTAKIWGQWGDDIKLFKKQFLTKEFFQVEESDLSFPLLNQPVLEAFWAYKKREQQKLSSVQKITL